MLLRRLTSGISDLTILPRLLILAALAVTVSNGAVAFEKLTDMDYRGNTYYTIRNLTLYECQGWCREEPECQAASFSFVPNLQSAGQETVCLLQNETAANNPSAIPNKAISTYYMVKLRVRSDKVCNRPWTFERLPNHMVRGLDNALIFTSTKEACLASCLNENRFICRSAEYNYVTLQCHLSEHDRRSVDESVEIVKVQGVDYFENLCLSGAQACKGERDFPLPSLNVPNDLVNRYIEAHFYVDLELMANNADACRRACEIENEILCRSFVYRGPPTGTSYNCQLFHMDHVSLPDGTAAFLSKDRPLYDAVIRPGTYYENSCRKPVNNMMCRQVVSRDKRFITQIMCYEKPKSRQMDGFHFGEGMRGAAGQQPLGTTATSTGNPTAGQDSEGLSGKVPDELFAPTAFGTDVVSPTSEGSPFDAPVGIRPGGGVPDRGPGGTSSNEFQQGAQGNDVNCDSTGTCYDVSVQCKDTRIAVQVATNRPFNGRVYALGRSETCNVDVFNSDRFRLDLTLSGQDCNTQGIGTVYSNTVVVQHHSVVMTKTDKIYKVRCTYDMSSKNITFGMLPISQNDGTSPFESLLGESSPYGQLMIRDPDMISITSAPAAPPPRIRILDGTGREVETVRIGDKLTFRIEIPNNTPYGIFARNCVAMAKDARSTFQIIDAAGCPVDSAIFPKFTSLVTALESVYEAFRFTESYGVIFQCNVKYCLGECEPAKCVSNGNPFESWGRRKRSLLPSSRPLAQTEATDPRDPESMTLSQEILVLDFGDEPFQHSDRRTSQPQVQEPDFYPADSTNFATDHVTFTEEKIELEEDRCPTKTSVLALSVACALMMLTYICSIFYMIMKRWMARNNKVL